jgi:hypothetical protein
MKSYNFEKFNNNIFILNYNDINNNISFKKIIKIPITIKSYNEDKEYINYKIIEDLYFENYFEKIYIIKTVENIKVNDDIEIIFNYNNNLITINFTIENLIRLKIFNSFFFYENFYLNKDLVNNKEHENFNNIKKISFLIISYDLNKITLSHYLRLEDNNNLAINIIYICLLNLTILQNEINFIHGDFKLNNILYSNINNNINFIDLEFSLFLKNNEFTRINYDSMFNLYLSLDNNIYISSDFLKLFDIYIFTLSFFMINNNDYHINFMNSILNNNESYLKNKNFCIFYIIYFALYSYSFKKNISFYNINGEKYLYYCKFIKIYEIIYKINIENKYIEKLINKRIIDNLYYIDKIFDDLYEKNKIIS